MNFPTGVVPRDAAAGRARMRAMRGGEGARRRPGPDCFSSFHSRVFGAKVEGLAVTCTPPTAD